MSSPTLQPLNERYGIAQAVGFEAGAGGLTRLWLRGAQGEARVCLHGAHVSHFQPTGHKPVVFMSAASQFAAGKPIRGGVPVCFPWFGPRSAESPCDAGGANVTGEWPGHGFARLREWEVGATARLADGRVRAELVLRSDDDTRTIWPRDFEARMDVIVGQTLEMALTVRNTGKHACAFEEALHTYFVVGDIRRTRVTGLAGARYLSKVEGGWHTQGDAPIGFTGETDRVYQDTAAACVIDDEAMGRRIEVAKEGSRGTVVWNPWVAKARAMSDFGDDEWPGMLCIETANVGQHAVTLKPGASHAMKAMIRVA